VQGTEEGRKGRKTKLFEDLGGKIKAPTSKKLEKTRKAQTLLRHRKKYGKRGREIRINSALKNQG